MSGPPAKADGDRAVFDDDRDSVLATRILQHQVHFGVVAQHVVVFERYFSGREVLTGFGGVRSGILPEDQHFSLHIISPPDL